jgi:Spy/CpxP family protein refolding chaperone
MSIASNPHSRLQRAALIGSLVCCMSLPAQSARAESPAYNLGEPVIALVPVIKQHEKVLKLDAAQREQFGQWLKTAPAKRKAMEDKLAASRLQLRDALMNGMGDTPERQAMIRDIGEQEAALVAMRANCVDNMRNMLTAEQFKEAVALYKASLVKTAPSNGK